MNQERRPRVHPVRIVLTTDKSGRTISSAPFRVDQIGANDGQLLTSLVNMKLSPWVGANGILLIDNPQAFPDECLAPAVLPTDIEGDTGTLKPTTRWILLTDEKEPHPAGHVPINHAWFESLDFESSQQSTCFSTLRFDYELQRYCSAPTMATSLLQPSR